MLADDCLLFNMRLKELDTDAAKRAVGKKKPVPPTIALKRASKKKKKNKKKAEALRTTLTKDPAKQRKGKQEKEKEC